MRKGRRNGAGGDPCQKLESKVPVKHSRQFQCIPTDGKHRSRCPHEMAPGTVGKIVIEAKLRKKNQQPFSQEASIWEGCLAESKAWELSVGGPMDSPRNWPHVGD